MQFQTVIECLLADFGNGVRNGDVLQPNAGIKGKVADAGQLFRQRDRSQLRAVGKSIVWNFRDAVRNGDVR